MTLLFSENALKGQQPLQFSREHESFLSACTLKTCIGEVLQHESGH
jgi:hypothetical protein